MLYLVFKLFKFGVSQAKKRKANKTQEQQSQDQNSNHTGFDSQSNMPNMPIPSAYRTGDTSGARNPVKTLIETALRFLQFVLGLTVIGLYGRDVRHGSSVHAKCVYAVVTGAIGTITALVYLLLPFMLKERSLSARPRLHLPLFVWEFVLFVLWLTLFGIFGKMYIGTRSDGNGDDRLTRMRHAVWVDLTNWILWIGTGCWAFFRWWKSRNVVEKEGGDADKTSVEG